MPRIRGEMVRPPRHAHVRWLLVPALVAAFGCGGGGGGGGGGSTGGGGTPTTPPDLLADAPAIEPGTAAMRRLTEAQYKASIADVLGDDVVVGGRVELDDRRDGFLAVWSSFVSVTPAGFEQYDGIARSVAEDRKSTRLNSSHT